MPDKFPTDQWIEAVRWHGDTKIAATVHTAEWADAKTLLATLENIVVEAESKQGAVVWSSAQTDPPAPPTDAFLSSSLCQLGVRSNGTSLRPCMWKRRDSGVGISRILSSGVSQSDQIKKAVGLRTVACSYGRNGCGSGPLWRHPNPGVDSPCIGMYSRQRSCLRFSSRVLQPAGQLHWKCLGLRTFRRLTAECLMSCGLTQ